MRRLLSRYSTAARETVTQHSATVEKFIGDAVMAVFGLPAAHGDDPDRALAAAPGLRGSAAASAPRVAPRAGEGRPPAGPVGRRFSHHRRCDKRRRAPATGRGAL